MSQLEVDKIIPQSGTTLTIGDSGDTITFADGAVIGIDTDTLYIDSTNNRVGIGTSSPSAKLDIKPNSAYLRIKEGRVDATNNVRLEAGGTVNTYLEYRGYLGHIWDVDNTERMRIDSSGNVGIGTTSPTAQLEVVDDTADGITARFTNSNANNDGAYIDLYKDSSSPADNDVTGTIRFRSNDSGGTPHNIGVIQVVTTDVTDGTEDGYMAFSTRASGSTGERMRIDSSGHFLFAKTSTSSSVAGIRFAGDAPGYAEFTRDGGNPLYLNRETNDGDIIRFAKDDTTRGSIGIGDNDLFIGKTDGGNDNFLRFGFSSYQLIPCTATGAINDDVMDLGTTSSRFDNIFATNGTIQTSDQNEKQSIQSLTASEMAVAQRISKLFKTFKWNSAVEKKGDSARTHTGIIAQDVQQAFSDEGLDAGNYGMFISQTWWEKEISVDAVAEELDEEGNVIVEGKDAYTYMDTKEEATEGYTEKTRLGIRYPELLSFVSSAFEQRLTNIETRLTALET